MTIDSQSSRSGAHPNTPPSRAPAGRRAKSSRLARTALALAVVLGTGAGSVAVAQAATTGPHNRPNAGAPRPVRTPPAAAGKVASVDTTTGDSFTLIEPNGTVVTVEVSSTTTYRDGKVTAPTFANLKVGEMVSVQGTTASGTVTATSVFIGFGGFGPGGGGGHGWGGRPAPASTT
jgi:hypothetical protein